LLSLLAKFSADSLGALFSDCTWWLGPQPVLKGLSWSTFIGAVFTQDAEVL
jgi:hypothetical protein